jgi:putative ABC transport system substrate-binding protein
VDRRAFLHTLASGLLATPLAGQAQETKLWRIGLLGFVFDPAAGDRWKALRDRLRDLGYVDGQNVVFESRWSEGRSRLPGFAAELVNAKVDIIVTAGSEAAAAAKQATSRIPIVTATGGDLQGLGVVESLARPGGNVTGVTSLTTELGGKRLELIKQLVPRSSRIAIVRDPTNRGLGPLVRDAEHSAKRLGITLKVVGVPTPKDLDGAFLTMKRERADAVMLAENTIFLAYRQHIADLAITHRLPMMAAANEFVLAGALLSYGTDYPDLFRRAAVYVDKILKGARPADLPVEQPTKFELVVNLKTAKTLGLTIPQSVLQRADQIVE